MAERTVEFWFEFASTYSHLAAQRIEPAAEAAGVAIRWRPFLLGPIFKSSGWDDSPFNIYEAKGAYMWRDMARLCEQYAVPFRKPSVFPRNGLLAARVATAAESEAWMSTFVRSVYLANFRDDLDIATAAVVRKLLDGAGCTDADGILKRAESAQNKQLLRDRTNEVMQRGAFGAPTFFVGDELFWGNDRLEAAIAWCSKG